MTDSDPSSDALVQQAANGDEQARDLLFARHRDRLLRMIDVRMDRRLATRLDPSDVVQDAFAEATRQLDDYLESPELPFHAWLRQVAWQRLMQLQRHHIQTQKRSITREQGWGPHALPDDSMLQLVEKLAASQTSPSQRVVRNEMFERVRVAMAQLKEEDREILALRHLEQLSVEDTAAILGMTASNVKVRHLRAVQKLQKVLGGQ